VLVLSIEGFLAIADRDSTTRALVSTHNNLFLKCGIRTHDSDEFGLSDDDIKAIDKDIEEANKFFAKVSVKESFTGESTESRCIENYFVFANTIPQVFLHLILTF
jgi:hypothetical protein